MEGWRLHVRVGDGEASQVVGSIAEEVKQSVAGCRHHLWDRLISSGLRYHETTEKRLTETERDNERKHPPSVWQ